MLRAASFWSLIGLIIFFSAATSQTVDTIWTRQLNGSGDGADIASAIALDSEGNAYVTGISYGTGTAGDITTIKYSPTGDTIWLQRYDGPAGGEDNGNSIILDHLGNVIVGGESDGGGSAIDYCTIKYDSYGNQLWVKRYNGPGNGADAIAAITTDAAGNITVVGYSSNGGTDNDFATIKYLPNGDTAWVRRFQGPGSADDRPTGIVADGFGNVYVTGYASGSSSGHDFVTLKYSSAGALLWTKYYNGSANADDNSRAITQDGTGNIYIAGESYGGTSNFDYSTIKYSPDGEELWIRRFDGPSNGDDYPTALTLNDSGDVFITGSTYNTVSFEDVLTVKYNSAGSMDWSRIYNGSANSFDRAQSITSRRSNIYICGFSGGLTSGMDIITMKYNSAGDTAWVRGYNGPAGGNDNGQDIAVDNNENVLVAGFCDPGATSYDFLALRYAYRGPLNFNIYSLMQEKPMASPIYLLLTDPDGLRFGKDAIGTLIQEISPATYNEVGNNVSIYINYPKPGNYLYTVFPAGTPTLGATFTIGITFDGLGEIKSPSPILVPDPGSSYTNNYMVEYKGHFMHGDANRSLTLNILDISYMINFIYRHGPEPIPSREAANANCDPDGIINILDVTYLLNFLYKGGPAPCF